MSYLIALTFILGMQYLAIVHSPDYLDHPVTVFTLQDGFGTIDS